MAKNDIKYCEYFDVKEEYFPCIDESAINSGEFDWKTTYPHETFIKLLKATERMLGGMTNKSIWIHGAKETFESEEGQAILKELGIEGDYEGIGHCILGYAAQESKPAAPRKDTYIYRI